MFEHPALASVREALLAEGRNTLVTNWGEPTPFLITGVERRYRVDVSPNPQRGRPEGLYGQKFRNAPIEVALDAIEAIDPPTVSNIVVFEAPSHGAGEYLPEEIDFCLIAAHSAMVAAVEETRRIRAGAECVVHTGFWGAGAYGGSPALMTSAQILAAQMAGVATLVFYIWEPGWRRWYDEGAKVAEQVGREAPGLDPERVVASLAVRRFHWGRSDGN